MNKRHHLPCALSLLTSRPLPTHFLITMTNGKLSLSLSPSSLFLYPLSLSLFLSLTPQFDFQTKKTTFQHESDSPLCSISSYVHIVYICERFILGILYTSPINILKFRKYISVYMPDHFECITFKLTAGGDSFSRCNIHNYFICFIFQSTGPLRQAGLTWQFECYPAWPFWRCCSVIGEPLMSVKEVRLQGRVLACLCIRKVHERVYTFTACVCVQRMLCSAYVCA